MALKAFLKKSTITYTYASLLIKKIKMKLEKNKDKIKIISRQYHVGRLIDRAQLIIIDASRHNDR
jgi:hypothetical protein